MKKRIILSALVACSALVNAADYVITDYGVSTDSTKLQTKTIQEIIDKASANGGGTIVIPKGVYLSGALFFKSNTSLQLSEGAVLKGSDNIADYPCIPSRMEGRKLDYYAALINAYQVNNFSISGPGTINGNGARYWKQFWDTRDSLKKQGRECTNLEVHRPRLLFIWGCNTVNIKNVESIVNEGKKTVEDYRDRATRAVNGAKNEFEKEDKKR
jgi:polygalacturonase